MSLRQGNKVIAGHTITDAGFISAFAGSTAPSGWLVCDGSAISRTDYADLFTAIGTTYGTGDGSTTFNLPDLSGKQPIYDGTATIGDTTNGKAPDITGNFIIGGERAKSSTATIATGSFGKYDAGYNDRTYSNSSSGYRVWGVNFYASRSSAIYDNTATGITPAGVYTLWCIKY